MAGTTRKARSLRAGTDLVPISALTRLALSVQKKDGGENRRRL
jgi:hypothetical protein